MTTPVKTTKPSPSRASSATMSSSDKQALVITGIAMASIAGIAAFLVLEQVSNFRFVHPKLFTSLAMGSGSLLMFSVGALIYQQSTAMED